MALIIKNGNIITEQGIVNGDMSVENERISKIAENIDSKSDDKVIDATGKIVMPGVIDAHVHFYMQTAVGRTIDNFETGTKSAAFGGTTTFIDYASPIEGKSLLDSLKARQSEAEEHSYIDFNLHMEVTGQFDIDFDEIKAVKEYGITSIKMYTTYGDQLTDERIEELLVKTKENNMLLTVHAENHDLVTKLKEEFLEKGMINPSYHADSRPHEAEIVTIKDLLEKAKKIDAPIYIVHVSTGQGAEIIREAKSKGQKVYGETCPHYLLLTEDCYKGEEPQKYIMTPPLRKEKDQELLWKNIQEKTFQCLTTDHCAFSLEDKLNSESCFKAIPGIPGAETLLPLMYSEAVGKKKISLEDLVKLLSTNPAKMFGLYPKKGVLAVGSDADITILDPEKEVILSGSKLHSAAGYTVYEGKKIKGYPVVTISRGNIICQNGKWLGSKPEGKFVKAKDIEYVD